jgi:hypothetical protein
MCDEVEFCVFYCVMDVSRIYVSVTCGVVI